MDIYENLILLKGEDKTADILRLARDQFKPLVHVTFTNRRQFTYHSSDVVVLRNPRTFFIDNALVYKNGEPQFNISRILYFKGYCRIVFRSGHTVLCRLDELKVIRSALDDRKSSDCFAYLKQVAVCTGLEAEGRNILADRYEKISFIREDSALAAFLSGKPVRKPDPRPSHVYFPFGFNLSQKKAVENALTNGISIIEGPPGTGKTQTILNIIANAVMSGESVAVVSGNNAATGNVYEKLVKYGLEFIAAPLGSRANKDSFVENQTTELPDLSEWIKPEYRRTGLDNEEVLLNEKLEKKNLQAELAAELDALEKEYEHFGDYYRGLGIEEDIVAFPASEDSDRILAFATEYEMYAGESGNVSPFRRLLLKLRYRARGKRLSGAAPEPVTAFCQNLFYTRRIKELRGRLADLERDLDGFDFEKRMKRFSALSMDEFRMYLAKQFGIMGRRRYYESKDLVQKSEAFMQDYPVVLSTTYSLRSSLSPRIVYDYVIVDEASQVDLATAALALSCAKKAVIVGDLKQLPNVVDAEAREKTDEIFRAFDLPEAYRYSENSLLSAAVKLFPKAPRVLLREHYRCHPEIIGFCNKRFYGGELIVMTEPGDSGSPMSVYRTAPGNHARGHVNQRQIEVIRDEVFPREKLDPDDGSVGIVTPYRAQANALQETFAGTSVKADTADKFQGQERSVIVFSTVDNEIGDFASDPNRLNVAVSRAKDRFIVVTDGNGNDTTSPIHELIGYIQYNNHETVDSEIHSIFDCLYRQNAEAREAVLKKHGRRSEFDSENLMMGLIREILAADRFSKYGAVMHVPLRMLLGTLERLDTRELAFATNHLTHVDFLIYSLLTHRPVLVVEVDGFAYHSNEKQAERDRVKDSVLRKFGIPILRLGTTGSGEKQKIISALDAAEMK
jgi:RecA/RadA recombinase